MARLSLEHVGARFGATEVLRDISLEVADGEFLVLVGPSGCGKSTLLRVVAGLVAPSAGEIRIDGRRVNELEPRERQVAMVFQNYALYPHRTVAKNLAFPLEIARVGRDEIVARVRETAEVLGLTALLERKPGRLSGGQMQRVALGRAIIRRPSLFLFDEPLSNLDAKLRAEMRAEIGRLHQRLSTTSLYVTHDQAEAMTMGSRIAVLDGGRIEQIGPPLEVYARPATRFVAGFIGSPAMNLVEGTLSGGRFRCGALEVPAPGRDGDALVLGLRPHALALRAPRAGELGLRLPATLVESLGSQTVVHLALGDAALVAAAEGTLAVSAGETVAASFAPADVHWFDARDGRRRSAP